MSENNQDRDFNHIKEWLTGKIMERGISTSLLSLKTGNKITNATLFRWYSDMFRPSEAKLDLVCKTLSRLPILVDGEPDRYEEVLLSEALQQFTPRERRDRVRKSDSR